MWYSEAKKARLAQTQTVNQDRQKLLNQGLQQALQMTGMSDQANHEGLLTNAYQRAPQWQRGDNFLSGFMVSQRLTGDEQLRLRQMWEDRKRQFVAQYNRFSYPPISGQGIDQSAINQEGLINDILDQAAQIHQENSYWNAQATPGGLKVKAPSTSPGWDFIRKQIASNPNLTPDSRVRLQREFAAMAESLYGQRARNQNPYEPWMTPQGKMAPQQMTPKNQELAKRYFQTQNLKALTPEQQSQFQEFVSLYTPAQQQQYLNMAREQRIEQRQVQQPNSTEYQDFQSRIQELKKPAAYERDAQDKAALLDEINASYMTPQQKQKLLKQLR